MSVVTEKWSERRYTRGVSASRVFQISGVSDEEQAARASNLPSQNSSHPLDLRLLAKVPQISVVSPGILYEAAIEYVRLTSGADKIQDNPLDNAIRIQWQIGNTTEEVDRDANDKPMINTAGDVFAPSHRQFGTLFLKITRNESSFDLPKSLAFQNKININSFAMQSPRGPIQVAQGQCLCHSIGPESEFTTDAEYIPISYLFEFREDGFDHRKLDQGKTGTYSKNGVTTRDRFSNGQGELLTEPVKLNKGKPIDTTIKVGKGNNTPTAGKVPSWATYQEKDDANFLIFQKYKTIDFTGLNL